MTEGNAMSEAKTFDLECVYDEKIAPLMTKIIEICKEYHMPMFATFLYQSDPEAIGDGEDGYCTTNLDFEDNVQSEEMKNLYMAVRPRRNSALRLTTKNADGNIVREEIILG